MRASQALLITVLELFPLTACSEPTVSREQVACFNDGDGDGDYGVWIYEGYSDWREARDNPRGMLVFGFTPGRGEYRALELRYCWYTAEVKNYQVSRCESGSLEVSEFSPSERILGRYSFALQDGTSKESEFSASFCPKDDALGEPAEG